jgi:hypothetical protein
MEELLETLRILSWSHPLGRRLPVYQSTERGFAPRIIHKYTEYMSLKKYTRRGGAGYERKGLTTKNRNLKRTRKTGAVMVHDFYAILLYLGHTSLQCRRVSGGAGGFGVEVRFVRHRSISIFLYYIKL